MFTAAVDESGGVRYSEYDAWTAEQQRNDAKRMKAQREFREEQNAERRRTAQEPKIPRWKKGKKGADDADGK